MKYQYEYRVAAADLWQMTMYSIYGSLAGVCNLVFTAAMAALAFSRWSQMTEIIRIMLLAACLWFPLIQPLLIYRRMKKQAAGVNDQTRISIQDQGLLVTAGGQTLSVPWDQVRGIISRPTMLIILLNNKQGISLTNRVLKDEKAVLYTYVKEKTDSQ